ncbi:MAG: hypothetical protein JWO06_1688 [Bacteroidota bacterium]|nr:hypothetical protein [Bacteroidota bacterium]
MLKIAVTEGEGGHPDANREASQDIEQEKEREENDLPIGHHFEHYEGDNDKGERNQKVHRAYQYF